MRVPVLVLALVASIVVLAPPRATSAESYSVPDGDVDALIQAMVDAAASPEDSIIDLAPTGTYVLTEVYDTFSIIHLGLPRIRDAAVTGTLTINGNGATITRDAGAPQFHFFHLAAGADLTLNDLTLTGGSDHTAGAIYTRDASLELVNASVTANSATGGEGGGIYSEDSALIVMGSTVSENTAWLNGGGIYHTGGTLDISGSTFAENYARGGAGGVWVEVTTAQISDSIIVNNEATLLNGGGVFVNGSQISITGSVITGNTAVFSGGGVFVQTTGMTVSETTIAGNATGAAHDGGGIGASQSDVEIDRATITGNEARHGGGVHLDRSTALVGDSTISGNAAEQFGGGIRSFDSTLMLTGSTVAGNTATTGGGIHSGPGPLTVTRSTVSGNSASNAGGGIFVFGGPASLSSVTVTENAGGGVTTSESGTTVSLSNTIVAGNASGNCWSNGGTFDGVAGSNVSDDATCPAPLVTQVNDAGLGSLEDNGGPTATHALHDDSPSIDAGGQAACDALSPTSDQRGLPRTSGPACDIGAFELQQPNLNLTKSAPTRVAAGTEFVYTLTVRNTSLGGAEDVVMTDILPADVRLVSSSGCAEDPAGSPTCTLGQIPAGGAVEVRLTVTAPAAIGVIENTASVAAAGPEADARDNEDSASVEVVDPALVVTKEGPAAAPPGATLTYLVTVSSVGQSTAEDVNLIEEPLGGSVSGYDTPEGVECSGTSCDLGDLAPGDTVAIWVHTTAPETDGTTGMTNTACAETSTPEAVTHDNCATVGTSIVAGAAVPAAPAVGPGLYQPEPNAPPNATGTSEPTVTATPEPTSTVPETPSATATSEPDATHTPTPVATTETPSPAATTPAQPSATTAPATEVPTATPTREAPMPPDTGSGTAPGGGSAMWLVLGLGALAAGAGTMILRRRAA